MTFSSKTKSAAAGLLVAFGALAAIVAAPAFGGSSDQATAAKTSTISVRDNSYSRSSISIKKNGTIKWAWRNTGNSHNVTSGKKNPVSFTSKTKSGSFSFSHKFTKRGTYKIFCSIHPDQMKVTVKVK